jgi:4-hydroxy-tetrahydrodipicolinate synthase
MLYVPLVTPFAASGAVDLDALSSLAADLLADGATGLVALGSPASRRRYPSATRALATVPQSARRGAPLLVGPARPTGFIGIRPEVTAARPVPPFVRPGRGVLAYATQLAAAPGAAGRVGPVRTCRRLCSDSWPRCRRSSA